MPKLPIVKIIDVKKERKKKGEFTSLSSTCSSALQSLNYKKEQAFVFINRRGLATSIVCQDCGFVFQCPHCDIPLTFHHTNKGKMLMCHHCSYSTPAPSVCPQCGGHRLQPLGLGTERIVQEVKEFFPSHFPIARIEGGMDDEKELAIINDFNKGKIKILIGTEALFRPQLQKADLVIVASIDPLLFLPDYSSEENTFAILQNLKRIAQKKIIVQTLIPDNNIFSFWKNDQEKEFFQKEIKNRQDYLWPPFVQLIKLTSAARQQDKGEKEALELKDRLEQALYHSPLSTYKKNFVIMGPGPAFIFKERDYYKWNILIKFKYFESKIDKRLPSSLGLDLLLPALSKKELRIRNKLLQIVPPQWKINVDPQNTL